MIWVLDSAGSTLVEWGRQQQQQQQPGSQHRSALEKQRPYVETIL